MKINLENFWMEMSLTEVTHWISDRNCFRWKFSLEIFRCKLFLIEITYEISGGIRSRWELYLKFLDRNFPCWKNYLQKIWIAAHRYNNVVVSYASFSRIFVYCGLFGLLCFSRLWHSLKWWWSLVWRIYLFLAMISSPNCLNPGVPLILSQIACLPCFRKREHGIGYWSCS